MASPRCAGPTFVMSLASISTCPEVTSSRPAMRRRSVDLPQPDGPDEHRELAVLDIEIDAVDDADCAKRLAHVLQLNASHGGNSLLRDHLTAPKVKPRTSCFCENQPRMRIGAMASVEAAESLAQKNPSGAE